MEVQRATVDAGAVSAKVIDSDRLPVPLLVVELPDLYDGADEELLEKIAQRVRKLAPGYSVLVTMHGIRISCPFAGGVYQRERLGDYEYEAVAADEATLRERLEQLRRKR